MNFIHNTRKIIMRCGQRPLIRGNARGETKGKKKNEFRILQVVLLTVIFIWISIPGLNEEALKQNTVYTGYIKESQYFDSCKQDSIESICIILEHVWRNTYLTLI